MMPPIMDMQPPHDQRDIIQNKRRIDVSGIAHRFDASIYAEMAYIRTMRRGYPGDIALFRVSLPLAASPH